MAQKTDILVISPDENAIFNWTSTLVQNLDTALFQLRNQKLNQKLLSISSNELDPYLTSSSCLLIVVDSKFTQDPYFTALQNKIKANVNCILLVLDEINAQDLIKEVVKFPTYRFYDSNPQTGLYRQYSLIGEGDESRLYWTKILDLSYDMVKLLFAETIGNEVTTNIYLAETTPDQYENRDAIRSELIHRGYKVYPNHILTGTIEDVTQEITSLIDNCSISVHIIGSSYGEHIGSSEQSLTELQCRMAAKRWRITSLNQDSEQFQRIVWIQPGIKPEDEKQRRFVNSLRLEDKDSYSEIMQTPLEELKANLREKLSNIALNVKSGDNLNKKLVYLIHEPNETFNTEPIKKYLQSKGTEVITINFAVDTENMVSKHCSFLSIADSVIIFDNDSNRYWINSKLKDLVKAPGFGRKQSFAVKSIFTKNKNRYKNLIETGDTLIIEANSNLDNAFSPFLQKLNLQ